MSNEVFVFADFLDEYDIKHAVKKRKLYKLLTSFSESVSEYILSTSFPDNLENALDKAMEKIIAVTGLSKEELYEML